MYLLLSAAVRFANGRLPLSPAACRLPPAACRLPFPARASAPTFTNFKQTESDYS
ncbi:hypothetical protein [Methanimicrococcus stummii]|uniref:hypothetical protein n=1 Tax=Methanimicrococcus stummii TaxID=3028294 RepID=UPI00292ECB51|nr:hypothetical protein [Methanimicrococcus sp. Es2]